MNGRRYIYEDVRQIVEKEGYELLSSEDEITNKEGFVFVNTYIKVKCPNINHESYSVRFDNFKHKKRCKKCRDDKMRYERNFIYKDVKQFIESFGYKLLSEDYKNNREPLLIQCDKNHQPYFTRFSNFKIGHRCPECYEEQRGDFRRLSYDYVKECFELFGYKLLSNEYTRNDEKLLIQCPNRHEYLTCFSNFQQGHRCPICGISKGEQRIMNWLEENNITYIYDKPYFNDLFGIGNGLLRPDFIIEDKKVWIEYDGEFHYKNKMNEKYYETLLVHDELKNEYAKKNNWRLIRIPYWDFNNIENILDKEIKGQ